MKLNTKFIAGVGLASCVLSSTNVLAAISMDRTRIIFEGMQKSVSLNVANNNKQLPYLAQGWIENEKGEKITSPLIVLPPIQRIEPAKSSQVKIEALPAINSLPQDRESLFYFNLREIPPKSDKPNTLQIALQTRVKLFYRPKAIISGPNTVPWQQKLTLLKEGNSVTINNPTPYYVTVIEAGESNQSAPIKDFKPIMLAPFSEQNLGVNSHQLGNTPVLTYVNDYGGRTNLTFSCQGSTCHVDPDAAEK